MSRTKINNPIKKNTIILRLTTNPKLYNGMISKSFDSGIYQIGDDHARS